MLINTINSHSCMQELLCCCYVSAVGCTAKSHGMVAVLMLMLTVVVLTQESCADLATENHDTVHHN
jgi:hypothetical protein